MIGFAPYALPYMLPTCFVATRSPAGPHRERVTQIRAPLRGPGDRPPQTRTADKPEVASAEPPPNLLAPGTLRRLGRMTRIPLGGNGAMVAPPPQ